MSGKTFLPGPELRTVRSEQRKVLAVPDGWVLLLPGDAALTRRVKARSNAKIFFIRVLREICGFNCFFRVNGLIDSKAERRRSRVAENGSRGPTGAPSPLDSEPSSVWLSYHGRIHLSI